jgi:hypothetical protein
VRSLCLVVLLCTEPVDNIMYWCLPGHKMHVFLAKYCLKLSCFLWSEGESNSFVPKFVLTILVHCMVQKIQELCIKVWHAVQVQAHPAVL